MNALLGSLPILMQFAAVAAQGGRPLAAAGGHDTKSLVQLPLERRQPDPMDVGVAEELLGTGREGVGVAEAGRSEAAKRAAAVERVKDHHTRLEKLRRYSTAADQLIDEEEAATRADKSSAGIPSEVADPPVVNLVSERFAVRANCQQKLVQIPRALRSNKLLTLRADAVFEHLGTSRCGGAFSKSVSFFGNWPGKVGVVELKPGLD